MRRFWPLIFALVLALPESRATAQSNDPLRFASWVAQDSRALVAEFGTRDAAVTTAAGLMLLGLSHWDRALSERAVDRAEHVPTSLVERIGNVKVIRPLTLVAFTGALMGGPPRLQDDTFTALEAVVLSNLTVNALKLAVGRARPYEEQGPGALSPFGGDRSFPSGHSATAFALVTPFYLYYPGFATASLFVLAGATAASRVSTEFHWVTDVLAGSAIGVLMARKLSRRHQGAGGRPEIQTFAHAGGLGVRVRF
jgi:hypothetical protein